MKLEKDIENLSKKLLKLKSNIYVFQTNVVPTSIYYKKKPEIVAKKFLNIIEKKFKNKTILFLAFSNDLANTKRFHLDKPNFYTGLIPKLAFKKKYFKSFSTLHGFLVRGKKVRDIKKLKQITVFGKGSVFEWLEKNNACWVAINLSWLNGLSFAHRPEEIFNVPYRFYKTFTGILLKKNKILKKIYEVKYSNYKNIKIIFNDTKYYKPLKKFTHNYKINKGLFVNAIFTKIVSRELSKLLKKDPFIRVENKEDVKKQLKKKKLM